MKLCKCKGNCTKIFRDVIIWLGMAAACYFMVKGFTCSISNRVNSIHIKSNNYTPMQYKTILFATIFIFCIIVFIVCFLHFREANKARKEAIKRAMEDEADHICSSVHKAGNYDDLCFICENDLSRWKRFYKKFAGFEKQKRAIHQVIETRHRAIKRFDWVEEFPMDKIRYITE